MRLQASLCAQATHLRICSRTDGWQGRRVRGQLALRGAAGPRGDRLEGDGPPDDARGCAMARFPSSANLCDHVTFNSLSQLRRLAGSLRQARSGRPARQPELSLVADERYDPCRPSLEAGRAASICLPRRWEREPGLFERVRGLLFHTNCDSPSFEPLHRTVMHLESNAGRSAFRPELDQPGRRVSARRARADRPVWPKRSSCCDRVMASAFTSSPAPPWFARRAIWSRR